MDGLICLENAISIQRYKITSLSVLAGYLRHHQDKAYHQLLDAVQ